MSRYLLGAIILLAPACALAAEPELHVVGLYEGHGAPRDHSAPGKAAVTVDRPGKEVVLIVSAHTAVEWDIRATDKTKLTRVIFGGYQEQCGRVPKGTEVEDMSRKGRPHRANPLTLDSGYQIDAPRFRQFVFDNLKYTATEITSFHGAYRADPDKPIVIDAIQKDERLSWFFPLVTPAAQVPKFKIDATKFTFGKHQFTEKMTYGPFTQAGPEAGKHVALPNGVRQVVYDAKGKQHYGLTQHDLHTVNLTDRSSTKLVPPVGVKMNWPRALTFDAKRNRVLVIASGGLFEYAPAAPVAWAQITNERLVPYSALVWQSKTDTLYSFGIARDPRNSEKRTPTLYEHNANGTVANKTALGSPLFPAILGEHWIDGRAELIDLGGDLALLVHCENCDSNTGEVGDPEAFLYVIDPKTAKVKLAWKE